MIDLRRGLTGNHGYPATSFCRRNDIDYDGSNAIDLVPLTQSNNTTRNFKNYDNPCERMIGSHVDMEDESDFMSPPLWRRSPPNEEVAPLQHHQAYDHHYHQVLSPKSRTEAIARGRQEMMEMVKNMPESSYELSLKDLVEQQPINVIEKMDLNRNTMIKSAKRKNKKKNEKKQMLRIESMDNGTFLLKMFFPISLGLKKKTSSKLGTCSKVSPRPPLIEGEKGDPDKYWLKKRFLVAVDSFGKSSDRSNSSRSRSSGDWVPGCWSFFNTHKSRSME